MSIRRKPRHKVEVILTRRQPDGMGDYETVELPPVQLRCNVHPVSAVEREALGLQALTAYRIKYHRTGAPGQSVPWPGGPRSVIVWNGRRFEQQGEALLSSMSPRTGHETIVMQAVSTEVR